MEPENVIKYAAKWVGKNFVEAEKTAELEGFELRCMELDGEGLIGIMNYDPHRINVAVEDGVITSITSIG